MLSRLASGVRHPVAMAGVVVTTVSAVVFITLVAAELVGLLANPYTGLLVFVVVPVFFVLGLLMIPLGRSMERRARARGAAEPEWPVIDLANPRSRRVTLLILVLTVVNLMIVVIAANGAVHWMDSPSFCGQVCHLPMTPEFTAWESTQHAGVKCTDCHVGEGARALVRSKLAGVRQLYHVVTNQIPKPIPRPADMRPALEICGNCHWPGRSIGETVVVKREYAEDEANSETKSTFQMMVGSPGRKTSSGRAIHWHADPNVRVEFVSSDEYRQTILYVRSVNTNGAVKEYKAEKATDAQIAQGVRRVMDCIDCHNTPAHRISPTAEQAVDVAIASGDINRGLPFVRREGVRVVKAEYSTQEEGVAAIEKELRAFYGDKTVEQRDLAGAITALQNVYRRNVFPSMKVTFGVYPDNRGHITSNGCFRCHDGGMAASDGTAIGSDCEYCHVQTE